MTIFDTAMNPLVSIIMPVYNAAFFLEETLQSVALQTYTNWQLVIVDDGSTDASPDLCKKFALEHENRCLLLPSKNKQSGAGASRNIGLELCTAEYVIFLDSDDTLAPYCLQQRIDILHANDVVIFKQYYWDINSKPPYPLFTGKAANREDAIEAFMRMEAPWQTMACIWRKTTLQKLNGFDEMLIFMEDPDLHLRALLDDEIIIHFAYDLPADNYYRVNNMSAIKAENFYTNSIRSRIVFLHKLLGIINDIQVKANLIKYKKYIREGHFVFLKNFVLARFKNFKEPVEKITNKLFYSNILRSSDRIRLLIVFAVYGSSSSLVKKFKLKGIAYKLIQ